jgi:uncharacterized protein YbjT (DUF2867 family)
MTKINKTSLIMSVNRMKIAVCGATGNQGGAVVNSLLQSDSFEVVAVTRDKSSKHASALAEKGATVIQGDLLNETSLRQAFTGVDAVFGVTQPWSADYKICDTNAEIRQGQHIIAACKAAGVRHLVFSSVLNLNNATTGVGHVDSKLELEKLIRASGLSYTIIRCAQFMENIGTTFFPVKGNVVKGFVDAGAKVPYVSCKDIGQFTKEILGDTFSYQGQSLELIGDYLSGTELAQLFTELYDGRRFKYTSVPKLLMWVFAREFFTMRRLFEKNGQAPYPPAISHAIRSGRALTTMRFHLQNTYQSPSVLIT